MGITTSTITSKTKTIKNESIRFCNGHSLWCWKLFGRDGDAQVWRRNVHQKFKITWYTGLSANRQRSARLLWGEFGRGRHREVFLYSRIQLHGWPSKQAVQNKRLGHARMRMETFALGCPRRRQ